MICAVHAIIAGAVGASARSRSRAFIAGVGTHLLADLAPHRDFSPPVELLMTAAALGAIGGVSGFNSAAFAGAIGGVAPDIENGLAALGVLAEPCFPTHRGAHGRRTPGVLAQVAISAVAFGFLVRHARGGARADGAPKGHQASCPGAA
ncbi:MAG: hypothetical protein JSV65_17925 [Armatimonadota bacterium]|nr:MAG: hypothetical protein JSV65_17925 [Armatimonadota bacterium]